MWVYPSFGKSLSELLYIGLVLHCGIWKRFAAIVSVNILGITVDAI
jgi:hypothetical protein